MKWVKEFVMGRIGQVFQRLIRFYADIPSLMVIKQIKPK